MIAALFAFAAALVATGWLASRRSHRVARHWVAMALVALGSANVIQIVREPGPWWPLLHWQLNLVEGLAALVWIAALALVWHARPRRIQAGLVLLAGGVAAFAFALSSAAIGNSASEQGKICVGAPTKLGSWTASLRMVQPVVGADYTGVQALVGLRFADGVMLEARPERRDYPAGSPGPMAGAQTLVRWNGELLVKSVPHRGTPECAALRLAWEPFAQWRRYGAWASLAGALLLLAASLRSGWWRAGARGRIAMRRDDHGRAPLSANSGSMGWRPIGLALACGAIAFAWQGWQQAPHQPVRRGAADGAAMIAARQAQFGGPHAGNRWLVIADALARHGQFGEAAQVLLGASAKEPGNAEAWLGLGDALYGHAGGRLVPAVELAYDRADRMAAPRPATGLVSAQAMATSGRKSDAEAWLCRDYLPYRQCPD